MKTKPMHRQPNPKYNTCPIAPHAHPLARRLFQIMDREKASLMDVAGRAGLHWTTMCKWKRLYEPSVSGLEAALNVMGYELHIRPRKEPAE